MDKSKNKPQTPAPKKDEKTVSTSTKKEEKPAASTPPPTPAAAPKAAAAAAAAVVPAKKDDKGPAKKEEKAGTPPPTAAGAAKKDDKGSAKDGKKKQKEPVREPTPEPKAEDFPDNPYIEVLAHRQRAVKKRLGKIEKNEEAKAEGQKLNEDQLASIAQKKEVLDLIEELDELTKHLVAVAAEQAKIAKAEEKAKKLEESKQAQLVKEQHQEDTRKILEFLYILNIFGQDNVRTLFTSGNLPAFKLSESQLHQLDSLNSAIFPTYDSSTGIEKASKNVQQQINKLFGQGKEELTKGLSAQKAFNLVTSIAGSSYFNVEVAKKLAAEKAAAEAAAEAARLAAEAAALAAAEAAEAARIEQEKLQSNYEIVDVADVPKPEPFSRDQINGQPAITLAFMGESELTGTGQVASFNQQPPTSHVPVFEQHQQHQQQHHQQQQQHQHQQHQQQQQHHQQHHQQQQHQQQHHQQQQQQQQPSRPKGNPWGKPVAASSTPTSTINTTTTTPPASLPTFIAPTTSWADSMSQESLPLESSQQQQPRQFPKTGPPPNYQQHLQQQQQQQPIFQRNNHHQNPNPNAGGVPRGGGGGGGRGGYRGNNPNPNYQNNSYQDRQGGYQKSNFQERNFSGGERRPNNPAGGQSFRPRGQSPSQPPSSS